MKIEKNTRRKFLKNTATIIAGFSIVPRHVLGKGFIAPSDQLTKGIIGLGGMGRGHIGYAGTRVVAICDVDKNHLLSAEKLIGGGVKTFHNHQELIALPEVDIVHIATPPHWHGIMAVDAAKAGKDIWCEKPMTRTIGEGKKVVEAVCIAADGLGYSPLEVALSWVRDAPGVTSALIGARTGAQLRGILTVEQITLPDQVRLALNEVSAN